MLFSRKKNVASPGLTCIGFEDGGVSAVTVVRSKERRIENRVEAAERKPSVTLCDFHPVSDEDNLTSVLKKLSRTHRLDKVECTTVLSGDDYKLILTEKPDVEANELKAAMRWRVKDLLDIPVDDTTIDIINIPADKGGNRSKELYVVSAPNSIIKERGDLLTSAKINLKSIDIAEMAQRNIAALLPEDAHGVALLRFQSDGGLITLTQGGELFLSRYFSDGIEALKDETIKTQVINSVLLEVQRSLDYYESHFRKPAIRHLMIAPLEEDIPGLLQALEDNLGVQVSVLNLEQILHFTAEDMPENWQARFLIGVGAALRQDVVV